MVDFICAEAIRPGRYDPEDVFEKALPHLRQAKSAGCNTLVACTPAYIGRDAGLLRRLSQEYCRLFHALRQNRPDSYHRNPIPPHRLKKPSYERLTISE